MKKIYKLFPKLYDIYTKIYSFITKIYEKETVQKFIIPVNKMLKYFEKDTREYVHNNIKYYKGRINN